jgi:transcriptional regulator with XRE-family HTH domain
MDKELAVVMGNAARAARQARQLTQDQVARLLGVSVEFYSRLERGRAHPSIDTFLRMLDVLGVSADALLGLEAGRAPAPVPVALSPSDPPVVRRLLPALCALPRSTVHLVQAILRELERAEADRKRAQRAQGIGEPAPAGDE